VQRPRHGRVRRGGVVSGRIRGETNTMPLHIEALYDDYNFTGALPWHLCSRSSLLSRSV